MPLGCPSLQAGEAADTAGEGIRTPFTNVPWAEPQSTM
jgi:hypothetical protein